MQQEYERFKLDAAAIFVNRFVQQRIIVLNFNIPLPLVLNRDTFERVREQVANDLPPGAAGTITPPYFQLSAVYTIVHRDTNEERLWFGSFNPRARDLSQVTAFRPLEFISFVDYCYANSQQERVENKLTAVVNGQTSVWTLGSIKSIIISVQGTVNINHSIFVNHPELQPHGQQRGGRRLFRLYFD